VLRSAQGLSFLVAPALGGFLSLSSLRAPFVVDGALSLAACALLFAYVPSSVQPAVEGRSLNLKGLMAVFSQRRVYAFALFSIVDNIAFPVLAAFIPVKAQRLGFAPWHIALILSMQAVGFSLATLLVGRLSDRHGRRLFAIAAQPLVILACLGAALSGSLGGLVGSCALFGLAGGATFLIGTVMMADITPPAQAAATLGMFDAAIDLAIFAAPALAIPLSGVLGIDAVLALAAIGAVAALPVALRVQETRVQAPRKS
jgi:MFS family permease